MSTRHDPISRKTMTGTGPNPYGFGTHVDTDTITRVSLRPHGMENMESMSLLTEGMTVSDVNMLFDETVRMSHNGNIEVLRHQQASPQTKVEFGNLDPRDRMGFPTAEIKADTRINYCGMTARVEDLVHAGIMTRTQEGTYAFVPEYAPDA